MTMKAIGMCFQTLWSMIRSYRHPAQPYYSNLTNQTLLNKPY